MVNIVKINPSDDYMLGTFDCALFVCDAISSGIDTNNLLREMTNIVVKFNDLRVTEFMKEMNVIISSSKKNIEIGTLVDES